MGSLPKRLRYFLPHEPAALIEPVLRIFFEAVEDRLKALESRRTRGRPLRGG
jgi:hypothetical protein